MPGAAGSRKSGPLDPRAERRLSWLLLALCVLVALAWSALSRQADRRLAGQGTPPAAGSQGAAPDLP